MALIHLDMPDDLHAWLKAQAKKRRRTIKAQLLTIVEKEKDKTNDG